MWTGPRKSVLAQQQQQQQHHVLGETDGATITETSAMQLDRENDGSRPDDDDTPSTHIISERLFSAGLNGQIIEWDLVNLKLKVSSTFVLAVRSTKKERERETHMYACTCG